MLSFSWRTFLCIYLLILIFTTRNLHVEGRRGFGNGEQDWGYITVRPHAHMFWWLFYTTAPVENYTERPLMVWLQGGPGMPSSGYGVFSEIGPLDADLNERKHTWIKDFNVLFIDNPVGVGFSYFSNSSDFVKDNREIGRDLVKFIEVFLNEKEEFQDVPTFIFGESYGGKMVVEFAYQLSLKIRRGKIKCNLKGIGLGDSYISPADYFYFYGEMTYNLGLVDKNGYSEITNEYEKVQELLDNEKFTEAANQEGRVTAAVMRNLIGVDIYNFAEKMRLTSSPTLWRDEEKLQVIMNDKVKPALNLSDDLDWQFIQSLAYSHLHDDSLKPVTDRIESLLNSSDIKIIVYNGVMDILVNTAGTARWLNNLKWKHTAEWLNSTQTAFVVNEFAEGYVKEVDNLIFYTVFRAGHSVPIDNPAAMGYILSTLQSLC